MSWKFLSQEISLYQGESLSEYIKEQSSYVIDDGTQTEEVTYSFNGYDNLIDEMPTKIGQFQQTGRLIQNITTPFHLICVGIWCGIAQQEVKSYQDMNHNQSHLSKCLKAQPLT